MASFRCQAQHTHICILHVHDNFVDIMRNAHIYIYMHAGSRWPNMDVPLSSSIKTLSNKLFPEISKTCKDVRLLMVSENKYDK